MDKHRPTLELEIDTLGYFLDRALNAMVKNLNKLLAEHGLDLQHAQYTILKVLWCEDGISQSQLSRILGKDPAAVSRALNYLETKGYVDRRIKNGKTNGVFLTDYANSRKAEIEHVAELVTAAALQGLSAAQKDVLNQLLTTVYNNSK